MFIQRGGEKESGAKSHARKAWEKAVGDKDKWGPE